MSNILKKSVSLILAALLITSMCSLGVSAAIFAADLSSLGQAGVKDGAELFQTVVPNATQAETRYASAYLDATLKLNTGVPDGLVSTSVDGGNLSVTAAVCTITENGCTAEWHPVSATLGSSSLPLQDDGKGCYHAYTTLTANGEQTVTVNYTCNVTLSSDAAGAIANFTYNAGSPYAAIYNQQYSKYQTAQDLYAIRQAQYLKAMATRDADYAAAKVTCTENARIGALDEFKVPGDYTASLYASLFDDMVDTVVTNKALLVTYFHVSAAVIDTADNATQLLRSMLSDYDTYTTHEDKYLHYCDYSPDYIDNLSDLYDSLTTLYADSNIRGVIDMKGKTQRFNEFLEQLSNEIELLETVDSATFDVTKTAYFTFQEPVFPVAPIAPTVAGTGAPADLQPIVSMILNKTLTQRTAASCVFALNASKSLKVFNATEDVTLALKSRYVSLGNDISVTYTADSSVTGKFDTCFLMVSIPETGIAGEYSDTEVLTGTTLPGGITFTYTGLDAKEMSDIISLRLYGVKDGVYYAGVSATDSICDYAMTLLNSDDTGSELSSLLCGMLNYGAAAQAYFGYNTELPANQLLDETQKTVVNEIVSAQRGTNDDLAGEPTAFITSSAAMPGNKVSVKYNINLASYTGDKTAVTLVIRKDGASDYVIPYSDFETEVGKDGYTHSAVYSGLDVCEMSATCSAALYANGTCISDSVTDSVMAYVYGLMNQSPSDALSGLLTAMIAYGNKAAAYEAFKMM